jgi:hypothetical protein
MNTKSDATLAGTIDGVWCSAAWNYEYTSLAITVPYPMLAPSSNASTLTFSMTGGDAAASLAGDMGSCCYTNAVIEPIIVAISGVGAGKSDSVDGKLELLNKWTCPAKFTNEWFTAASKKVDDLVFSTTSWWCSDGSFNMVGGADTANPAASGTA